MVPETSFHGQPLSEKGFHEASGKALKDQKLRKNFKRAMNGLMQKRRIMFPDSGELETLRNLAGGIRRDAVSRLPDLLEVLETNCQQNGIQVPIGHKPLRKRIQSSSTLPGKQMPNLR
ncbi:MAG: hypothetical protein VX080_00855 [SAR324 cluster bacterium]|nr:hypothetical protein [SAR324 cluster bacterium]